MKRLRILLGVVIVSGLALVAVLSWRAAAPSKAAPVKGPTLSADLKLDRVRYTETREGVKEWELEAASAQYFKNENIIVFQQIRATFFGKDRQTYVLVGQKGQLNTQTKAIEISDGVKLDSSDGYHLRTESLKYETERRWISTPDGVELSGPQMRVKGVGLIVEIDQQRMKILRQVSTEILPGALKGSLRFTS